MRELYVGTIRSTNPVTGRTTSTYVVKNRAGEVVAGPFDRQADAYVAAGQCPLSVADRGVRFSSHICGREIRTEGARKCNLHLSVDRRRNREDEERRAQYARSDANRQNATARAASIAEKLGELIDGARVDVHYVTNGRTPYASTATGRVVIDARHLEMLIEMAKDTS
jgi:hypothetical protein